MIEEVLVSFSWKMSWCLALWHRWTVMVYICEPITEWRHLSKKTYPKRQVLGFICRWTLKPHQVFHIKACISDLYFPISMKDSGSICFKCSLSVNTIIIVFLLFFGSVAAMDYDFATISSPYFQFWGKFGSILCEYLVKCTYVRQQV